MTMAKLAELAGVSVSTVSKAFSGSTEISDEKREYIFSLARKYGCYDKYCKASCDKKVIAVVCPEFKGRYYSEQLAVLEKEIRRRGAVMIAGVFDFDLQKQNELIAFFSEYSKVDGIIAYNMRDNGQKYSLPIVSIGNETKNADSIRISMDKAFDEAIEYLTEQGHKKIAFIGETNTEDYAKILKNTVKKYKCDLTEYTSTDGIRFEEAGYECMNKMFESGDVPTAVIGAYDYVAIGAMRSIYEHGLRIPDDISIIGVNDIKENPYLNVPLTSITTYIDDLCQIAVDILFEKILSGGAGGIKTVKVSAELIKRKSVGKINI